MSILGLIRDLMFRSKIDAVADSMGLEIGYASSLSILPKRCADLKPSVVVVDLSDKEFPAAATIAAIRQAAPQARVIGFASHVDLKAMAGAREAGFERVLSRQEFAAQMPSLLSAASPTT